jgi:hypothetical protein
MVHTEDGAIASDARIVGVCSRLTHEYRSGSGPEERGTVMRSPK